VGAGCSAMRNVLSRITEHPSNRKEKLFAWKLAASLIEDSRHAA
jgi:hypothetical protein